MAAAQPPWPPPGSPQFAGVRDAWRDATLAEWFLHHPQGKALFRIRAAAWILNSSLLRWTPGEK